MTQIVDLAVKGDRSGGGGKHPCFHSNAQSYARMHIPIATFCNISCNYCNRKYDCQNESRPGVTSGVLGAKEALQKFRCVKKEVENLKVVGVAGPGDALADFGTTKEALELIRQEDPDIAFCLSTNGLLLPKYAYQIIALGIEYVTITINAVDPEIGKLIYRDVHYAGKLLNGIEGAEVLIQNQLGGLRLLAKNGVICKVNTVMIKGINDTHVEEVVKTVRNMGAYISNIMPLIPTEKTPFAEIPLLTQEEIHEMRAKCEKHLKQMHHCRQCRADAIGTLAKDRSVEFRNMDCRAEPSLNKNQKEMIL